MKRLFGTLFFFTIAFVSVDLLAEGHTLSRGKKKRPIENQDYVIFDPTKEHPPFGNPPVKKEDFSLACKRVSAAGLLSRAYNGLASARAETSSKEGCLWAMESVEALSTFIAQGLVEYSDDFGGPVRNLRNFCRDVLLDRNKSVEDQPKQLKELTQKMETQMAERYRSLFKSSPYSDSELEKKR